MLELVRGQWKELTSMVDGFSIMAMEGLLLVPLMMAALFYPVEVLVGTGVVLLVFLALFEVILYARHHLRHH
jgi:uncharacterized membrane protein YfcA